MPSIRFIYSTHPTRAQARKTAKALLEHKLVACCNILPEIESHYRWEGKATKGNEVPMISKTTATKAAGAMKLIRKLHPYDVPAIASIEVKGGDKQFLQWIARECASKPA